MSRIRRVPPSVPYCSLTACNMLLPLTLLVLAGIAHADYDHGWKVGSEYTYIVRSRTLTSLDKLSDQHTGVLLKALLTVQVKDANTLGARLSRGQFANIHKDLPEGWDTPISDQNLDLRDLPITGKPFEIKIKQGVIRDLIVDKNMPTWEVNLVKSIVSQLQVDTLGANAITHKQNIQVPKDDEPYASFPVMEDSVGGKCEVRYDIAPLPDFLIRMKPDLVPLPKLKGDGHHIDITKTKNFDRCDQRMGYHFGISDSNKWEPGSNNNGDFLAKSSNSRVIISGSLKRFVIQSSVTTSVLSVSPRFYDEQVGIVVSRMNLTLADMKTMDEHLQSPADPESTGNLVYVYDNPFSDVEQRRNSLASKQTNWLTSDSVRSVSSSEEVLPNKLNLKGSDSSSGSSSSISSSEENHFWQPKPTLEDAPQNPLLPHFVGNNGKHIGHQSGNVDTVKAAKDIIFEIANELERPSDIPDQETLEKFTLLTSLLRTMSKKKLTEIEGALHIIVSDLNSQDKSQVVKQNAWAVFRDAVTQAGTGPALLVIKTWIKNKDISCMEAADVVSRIPKNARTPTAEFVRAFFELATSPEVLKDKVLRVHAILSFSELVRKSQVNKRAIHNRYPVHTFGRMTSKHDTTVVTEYIPYLEKELKNAVKDGNSPMIQTYILALGGIAHPKILAVFEPFLEGKERSTVFQRTLMIASLSRLAEINPKLAQSVLYKIYLNTMEAHQVRCAAVFLLMKTNPPAAMLQRMADFTNYDTNKNVNSAVKSSILGLSMMTKWGDIATRARNAANLLSTEDYSYQYSHGILSESIKESQNVVNDLIINYISSDDNIPSTLYIGSFNRYGDFRTPPTELAVMLSNVERIIDILFEKDKSPSGKMPTEKLADELKITPEDPIDIEGNIMWDNKYVSKFLPFDARTLRNIPNLISIHGMDLKNGVNVNLNKLSAYEVTLSFPTETGLPFLYTLKVPVLQKLSGKGKVQFESDKSMNIKVDARPAYSMKIQGRIGFLVPFERQHFIAGVDMNFQAYLPSRINLDISPAKGNMKLKMLPLKGEEKAKMIHYSVVPYTSKHDILHLQPVLTDKNTRVIRGDEIIKKQDLLPMSEGLDFFALEREGDKDTREFWDTKTDVSDYFKFPWTQMTNEFRKSDLYLNAGPGNKEPFVISAAWNSLDILPGEETEQWTKLAKSFAPSNPGSEETRKNELLKEVGKGIKAARSVVLDMEVQFPGEFRTHSSLTVAYSESNAENKRKALLFWKMNMPENTDVKYQVCIAANQDVPSNTMPSYEMAQRTTQKEDVDVDIRFGPTCQQGEQLNLKGEGSQSKKLKELLQTSYVTESCKKQMEQGNKILRDCQNVAALSKIMDEYKFSLNIESVPLKHIADMLVDTLANSLLETQVDTAKPRNEGKNTIDLEVRLTNNFEKVNLDIYTNQMDMHLKNIPVSPFDDLDLDDLMIEDENVDDVMYDNMENSCMIDKTRVETFDDHSYPLRLGKCWHAIMTTFPKLNPEKQGEKLRIPEEMSVSVLAREVEGGHKEVKIMLGEDEIKLLPGESEPVVQLNSQPLKITQEKGYQKRKEDDLIFEINRLADNSIAVTAEEQDVKAIYDGMRILIKASDDYRNSVRGLCGNFDGQAINDFWGPENCVMRTPEMFIASYALTRDQCEGPSMENARLAREHCTPMAKIWHSNVVSDIDAGRQNTEKFGYQQGGEQPTGKHCSTHRTQFEETDDKICFTTRPVVTCAHGCSPVETKHKNYQYHCMEKTEAALNLKRRIEKGANPDLSQKRIDMSKQILVPLSCKA
ncbi:vitellogenin [Halictus rubicundus]|uniref:vitellogenin n=1 Tax=Halictus rubicundus TaxID=77578 RepID=UPI004035ABB1